MEQALTKVNQLTEAFRQLGKSFMYLEKMLDAVAHSHTAFPTFNDLVNAQGGYFPSLHKAPEGGYNHSEIVHLCDGRTITRETYFQELDFLAMAYDMAQEAKGDARRAFRS